ncbi:hypothetical protein [Fodinicola feengrottensis]|uniref:hypothetical protein n=1 Tax=Fodinicola feengrottensis TaxID=435914 RepID=UPI0013D2A844|nr:hypothetical protein [Fodinicola feengrottensis]
MSAFGEWTTINGVPAFQYTADPAAAAWDPTLDPPTHRRWIQVGNRRITLVADNFGRSGLWDEHTGLDWLTEPFPAGTGVSRLADVLNTDENVTPRCSSARRFLGYERKPRRLPSSGPCCAPKVSNRGC